MGDTYKDFLDNSAKKKELQDKILEPGMIKKIHLFDIDTLVEPKWANVQNKPEKYTPSLHHESHENMGSDEISVEGLSGELADDQPPKAHTHDDRYYTEAETDDLFKAVVCHGGKVITHKGEIVICI